MPTKCQRNNEDNSERGVGIIIIQKEMETNFSKYKKNKQHNKK